MRFLFMIFLQVLSLSVSVTARSEQTEEGSAPPAGFSGIYFLTSTVWPSGLSETTSYLQDGRVRVVSNVDFTRLPQMLEADVEGSPVTFLNFASRTTAEQPSDWPPAILHTTGVSQFVTGWDSPETSLAKEIYFDALEALHAYVDGNLATLVAKATADNLRAEKARLAKKRQLEELERKFQLHGRLPSVLGMKHLRTVGGKPVDARHVVTTNTVSTH